MACMWKGRANLLMYCSCCSNWTRSGCVLDIRDRHSSAVDYKTPAEIVQGAS